MTVIDSSGWIEIATDGPQASRFQARVEEADLVLVPTVVVYEVHRLLRREASEVLANTVAASLRQHRVIVLDERLARESAIVSLRHRLPMADAIIYATAQAHDATLVTSDAHFASLPGVEYLPAPA